MADLRRAVEEMLDAVTKEGVRAYWRHVAKVRASLEADQQSPAPQTREVGVTPVDKSAVDSGESEDG